MEVEPLGLPVAMKAWREREAEPVLTVRCGAPDCGAEVGAVYRSPHGMVLESWLNAPEANTGSTATPASPAQMEAFAEELGLTGLLDDFDMGGEQAPAPPPPETEKVRAQVDLVGNQRYWQNPAPLCPTHGNLAIDRAALDRAVRQGLPTHEPAPPEPQS